MTFHSKPSNFINLTISRTVNGKRRPEYRTWEGMKRRCNVPKQTGYKYYGGKGITYDPAWEDFSTFIRDVGLKPFPRATLDRYDPALPYSKSNCHWASYKVQNRNKTNNFRINYKGKTKVLADWCEILGLNYKTTYRRLKVMKWTVTEAFETPVGTTRRIKNKDSKNNV